MHRIPPYLQAGSGRLLYVANTPPQPGPVTHWPPWVPPQVHEALTRAGIHAPWQHQTEAANTAFSGTDTVIATGTASGKSLAYQLPTLTALYEPEASLKRLPPTALYLAPTKALTADQCNALQRYELPSLRTGIYDGDTDTATRQWVRKHANLILTNPDMLHAGILPHHPRWSHFLRGLRYVIIDEIHHYRGVRGSHVAAVLRRLHRLCSHYTSTPVFIGASATIANPAAHFSQLTGRPAHAVTHDTSPHTGRTTLFWQPHSAPPKSVAKRH